MNGDDCGRRRERHRAGQYVGRGRWQGLQRHQTAPFQGGGPCGVGPALVALHVSEVAVMLDELSWRGRHRLERVASVEGADDLAARLVLCVPDLDPQEAHSVAETLVRPLLPDLEWLLDGEHDEPAWLVVLLQMWPPGVVRVLARLVWEVAGLSEEVLRDGRFEALCRTYGAAEE